MKEFLMSTNVQIGIFLILFIALTQNFIVKLYMIKSGIYKRVYKQKRIDWEKVKNGIMLLGFAGVLIAKSYLDWSWGITFLAILGFIGLAQMTSGLFWTRRSWKNHKYWD